jgi:two-component system NtrC family sensor kinase
MPGLSKLRRKQRRETYLIICLAAGLILAVFGFFGWEIIRTYGHVIDVARQRAGNLTLVLDEQTKRTVQVADFALLDIADRLREAPDTPSHAPRFTARLRERLLHLPYVRALFVIGADGFLLQDSDAGTPNVSLADRDYFKVHVDDPNVELYIGPPLKSRSTQIGSPWFLSMSRRITLPDGRFYGVAVAAVEPRYFSQFYERINIQGGSVVALIHSSGSLIARYPKEEASTGISLADARLFTTELPRASSGTYFDVSRVDGVTRLYGYRSMTPLPLVVSVGLNKASLLADWQNQTLVTAIAAGAFVLIVTLGTVSLIRRRARDLELAEHLQRVDRIEAVGQIASSIAHDFNNVLTIIGGNLELAHSQIAETAPSHKRLATALDGVERGRRMASRLLAFARQQPASPRQHENLCARLADIADLLEQAARPCELRLRVPDEKLFCVMDNGEFERALLNLVVNARDAMTRSGIVSVSIRPVSIEKFDRRKWPGLARGEYLACVVQDQGEGMPPDVLRRVFEPFFTTKPEGIGTGLGLSQVFGFARASGGGVHIESTVGGGTTVTLMLPQAPALADAAPSALRAGGPDGLASRRA